jgi:AcrR family transcriptional regulator
MMQTASTTSRERVLQCAAQLFGARGYTAVSMRDIADSLAMRQASLYYHVPEGKEQLYAEVALRGLRRHQQGIQEAIAATRDHSLDIRLLAVGEWFMNNAPLRLLSMLETDMAALSEKQAAYLTTQAYEMLFAPVAKLFADAQKRGEIRAIDPAQIAGYFLSLMDGISYSVTSGFARTSMDRLIGDAIDLLLNGLWLTMADEDTQQNSTKQKAEGDR